MKHRETFEPKAARNFRRAKAIRQLRVAFGAVMGWIAGGRQVEIIKKVKLPDFEARRKRIFGDRVLPGNAVAEERESYKW